ncbi:hypothetical protein Lal_00027356 [Lupinus albus]|uniref:Putative transcription factor Homeodomain-TALE-BEL family n=1 Tax=Lupinus albus TaxID=3870 RepID=A0A6A5MLH5_LUPAL|nr:putative transcription factor Homeodomain-TALE-BEL family [Lupinus albus]KAF1873318.1 hypothetical protein Lal_00027356 [Lupinus albus]
MIPLFLALLKEQASEEEKTISYSFFHHPLLLLLFLYFDIHFLFLLSHHGIYVSPSNIRKSRSKVERKTNLMARQVCEGKLRDMVSSSSAGFSYSDHVSPTHHLANQIQGFVSDSDIFNLTTNMEMIGFHKNQLHQQQQQQCDSTNMWESNNFFSKLGPSTSTNTMNESSTTFYEYSNNNNNSNKPDFISGISETTSNDNLIIGTTTHEDSAPWQDNRLLVDDSSFRSVFPCEGNERPSQGLSLSLSSTNPSSISLQSFELRHTAQHHHRNQPDLGFFVKSQNVQQHHQQQILQDGYLSAKAASVYQGHYFIKNSKYLVPAQELLNEFCNLGTKQSDMVIKHKLNRNKQREEDNNIGIGSSKKPTLTSLEFVELQKRKTKLLLMLEEVGRRYKHYRNQMKAVVSSFEEVAGDGAATVYSALALKAMSRHFKCLKDEILGQIQATGKSMGEKDSVAAGATRGETPRLKVIDQTLRQQKTFQQMTIMETHPWRPQRGLPERSVSVLRAWLFDHFLHPYPSDIDKHILARQTGLSRSQVSNWFINARVRLWKPMVEEMYIEEVKEHENDMTNSLEGGTHPDTEDNVQNQLHPSSIIEEQKPILRIDTECASSIINNHNTNNNKNDPTKNMTRSLYNQHHMNPQDHLRIFSPNSIDTFGSMELDFSSYNHHHSSSMVPYTASNNQNANLGFNNDGSSGVSLTLGLQQHGESGVSLAFPSTTHQSSLFYTRDPNEDCQTVEYSFLDCQGQNLQYRNLMGAQLLHDLAG